MLKHKIISVILISVILVILSAVMLRVQNNPENKNEVVFWTLQMGGFSDYINDVISRYETQHPDVRIKWIDVPFSEGEKRTLAAILSNNPPDLVNLNPDFSEILARKGALEQIDEDKLSEFNKDIIESLKYNGKLYAIPWYATSAVTIYNKSLYKKSGIKKFPKTYEDIAEISKQVKENTGCFAYFPTITENDTMLKILNKYGVKYPDNINSAESVRIFEMFKALYRQKLIPAESITQTHQEALEKYMSGNVVFFSGGANFLSMIKDNAPSVYKVTDAAPQIIGRAGQNDFSLMNFVIPLRSKHKKEALDFCLFLTNEKNQLTLAEKTNVISTNKYALQNEFYNSEADIEAKARKYSARQITNVQPVLKRQNNQKDINVLINTAVQSVLSDKDKTEKILNDVFENPLSDRRADKAK